MSVFICIIVLWTILGAIGDSSFTGQVYYDGCYNANNLPRHMGHQIQPFQSDQCFQLCSGNGHKIAALDSLSGTCYCNIDIWSQFNRLDDSLCVRCQDNSNYYCGGLLKVSLYTIEPDIIPNRLTTDHPEMSRTFTNDPVILLAGHGGIYMYNGTETNNKIKAVISVDYTVYAIDYHLKRKEGFAIWDDIIYRFPLFEDVPLEKDKADAVADVNRCPTFAVDWVHDFIFWPDCNYHTIKTVDINSNLYFSEQSIVRVPDGAWALDMAIDPYKGLLFWTTGATLMSCRLDGRELQKVVPEFPVNRVSSLSLDLFAEHVFCTGLNKHDKNTSMLFVADYTGRPSFSFDFHQYESGHKILNFGLMDRSTYFYLKYSKDNYSDIMYTDLRPVEKPKLYLAEKDHQLNRLRLVHPQLQSPPTVNACTNRGCTHLCVMENSLPQCYCPRFHVLEHDNKTCFLNPGEEEENPHLIKVVFGLMLVMLVLMGAVVLMCLCDKLWSKLRPVVVRLRDRSATSTTFTEHREQGSENLI